MLSRVQVDRGGEGASKECQLFADIMEGSRTGNEAEGAAGNPRRT